MKSLKTNALEWIDSLLLDHSINKREKINSTRTFYFKIEEFADEPECYIRPTNEGLEFGFEAIKWDGYMASSIPRRVKKHVLTWETVNKLEEIELEMEIFELLMKTITSRKRQYRKCQFCGELVSVEHRFDKDTCHTCASEHFGVVY